VAGPHEHPVGPAFDKAREWETDQARRLTNEQRRSYEDLKTKQDNQRRPRQERIDAYRRQLDEQAKNRKTKAELVHNPPVLVPDPYIRIRARLIIQGEKRLESLDRKHTAERIKLLKGFEKEREQPAPDKSLTKPDMTLTKSWQDALQKSGRNEADRDKDHSRDLTDDFGKGR
jgi:hypothetical protein